MLQSDQSTPQSLNFKQAWPSSRLKKLSSARYYTLCFLSFISDCFSSTHRRSVPPSPSSSFPLAPLSHHASTWGMILSAAPPSQSLSLALGTLPPWFFVWPWMPAIVARFCAQAGTAADWHKTADLSRKLSRSEKHMWSHMMMINKWALPFHLAGWPEQRKHILVGWWFESNSVDFTQSNISLYYFGKLWSTKIVALSHWLIGSSYVPGLDFLIIWCIDLHESAQAQFWESWAYHTSALARSDCMFFGHLWLPSQPTRVVTCKCKGSWLS